MKVSTVDFLKPDCEGAEHVILESLAPSRLDSIERISAEYHDLSPGRNGESLGRLLRQAGFHVRLAPEKRILRASRKPLPPPG